MSHAPLATTPPRCPLADEGWTGSWRSALEHDPVWHRVSRWFSAAVEFRYETGSTFLEVRDTAAPAVSTAPAPRGADITLKASDGVWHRLIWDDLTFYEALAAQDLTLRGDLVLAMHNLRALDTAVRAMREPSADSTAAASSFSPDPAYPPADTQGRYVPVDGIRTYYEEAGQGVPLVCLHAAAQDTLMYRHVLDGLSHDFRVIAVDAPGHGKTLEPPGGPFMATTQHAEFCESFFDALGLDRPVIIGCSMAGNMVLELAARRPGAYRAVVSAEGAAHTPTLDQFTLDMIEANGNTLSEVFAGSLTGRRTPPARAWEAIWQLSRATPQVMRADLTGYKDFDKRAEMSAITCPVLLVRGDADWLVSQEMVEATADAIPDSVVAVLAGTGHYPMIENPVEFNDAVLSFLARR